MATNEIRVKCAKCRKFVYETQNSICCDNCNNWVHLRCSGISKKEFQKLSNDPKLSFCCKYCQYYKCGKCFKPVLDDQNALQCDNSDCSTWYHLGCTKVSLNKYQEFNKEIDTNTWICSYCYTFPFEGITDNNFGKPFYSLNKIEKNVLMDIVNQNFKTTCSVCKRKIRKDKLYKDIPCKSCTHLVHRKCSCISIK